MEPLLATLVRDMRVVGSGREEQDELWGTAAGLRQGTAQFRVEE